MSLGAMQDWPLRIMRLMDHAEREHAEREIVAARPDGTTVRTNWKQVANVSRRSDRIWAAWRQRHTLEKLGR